MPTKAEKAAMLNAAMGMMPDQQRKAMGMQQMSQLMAPPTAMPPTTMPNQPAAAPGQQSPATGGLGAGGYQGAASALGPPVTHGKLGNGPGVNMMAGGQTAGGIKVGTYSGCKGKHMRPGKLKKRKRNKLANAAVGLLTKEALVDPLTFGGVGALGGAITSPSGKKMEGTGRGATIGAGTGLGAMLGMGGGGLAGGMAGASMLPLVLKAMESASPEAKQMAVAALIGGGSLTGAAGGGLLGGYAGNKLTRGAVGKPSWEEDQLMQQQ